MKLQLPLIICAFGLVLIVVFSQRYKFYPQSNGIVYRFDTFTGRTWKGDYSHGIWVKMLEPTKFSEQIHDEFGGQLVN